MSQPVSPFAIGSFTLGALGIFILALYLFAGENFFNGDNKTTYVIFFDSSLNGLEVGAPVKMQGVKIGEVKGISLLLEPDSAKIYKPVTIEIDNTNLIRINSEGEPKRHIKKYANRDKLIEAGFRARLEMQSLLTGMLYIDFDVHRDKPIKLVNLDYQNLPELPAIPTSIDEIRSNVTSIMERLQKLPLEDMVSNFNDSLKAIKELLTSEDIKVSRAALRHSLQELDQALITINQGLTGLLKNTDQTLLSTDRLVNEVSREIIPVIQSVHQVLESANQTLVAAEHSISDVGDGVGPESKLSESLQAVDEAASAIKNLADFLERHPESIIFGKPDEAYHAED
jgi:paraquat-inducible protein B